MVVLALAGGARLDAQTAPSGGGSAMQAPTAPSTSPFLGGVPTGTATSQPIALTAGDAISRALAHNLGVLEAEAGVNRATGARWIALSGLLPNVNGRVSEVR